MVSVSPDLWTEDYTPAGLEVNARNGEVAASVCANCNQDSVEALAPQFAYCEVASRG